MSTLLPHPEIASLRPKWLAGAPGFELGNDEIKIRWLGDTGANPVPEIHNVL